MSYPSHILILSKKKKSYYIEQDGPNCGVVVAEKHISQSEPLLATRKIKCNKMCFSY